MHPENETLTKCGVIHDDDPKPETESEESAKAVCAEFDPETPMGKMVGKILLEHKKKDLRATYHEGRADAYQSVFTAYFRCVERCVEKYLGQQTVDSDELNEVADAISSVAESLIKRDKAKSACCEDQPETE